MSGQPALASLIEELYANRLTIIMQDYDITLTASRLKNMAQILAKSDFQQIPVLKAFSTLLKDDLYWIHPSVYYCLAKVLGFPPRHGFLMTIADRSVYILGFATNHEESAPVYTCPDLEQCALFSQCRLIQLYCFNTHQILVNVDVTAKNVIEFGILLGKYLAESPIRRIHFRRKTDVLTERARIHREIVTCIREALGLRNDIFLPKETIVIAATSVLDDDNTSDLPLPLIQSAKRLLDHYYDSQEVPQECSDYIFSELLATHLRTSYNADFHSHGFDLPRGLLNSPELEEQYNCFRQTHEKKCNLWLKISGILPKQTKTIMSNSAHRADDFSMDASD